ncbi:glycosyltransferase family 2 protein [Psychroflexus sp. ALD_RP9]|uniref:glycosyltransferase family 2 protein n=1 Tax=Psychroflexus sp. ALD_RP9 TaxID=2777186 RepID=UPI001A8BF43B|nr:glycosyltransferase family 2 protein [Psychroflexus sp. ALD_RP9]QSS96389.1 glycosyltransferase family 2 protein [Psychroflexus sp. ALD_RP9]
MKTNKKRIADFNQNDSTNKPLVSICMLTYNHENFIRESIDSILMQQVDFPIEVLIHDDASTDNTQSILKSYHNKYPGLFKLKLQVKNQRSKFGGGMNPRFNYPRAKGKYIALLEGDDYWTDSLKLQKQVDFLEANEAYSMCFTRFQTKNEVSGLIEKDNNGHYFVGHEQYIDFNFEKFYKGWHIGTQSVVFKKNPDVLKSFHDYKMPRDVHLYTELLKHGKGACLKDFCAMYRITGKGVYTSISKRNQIKKGAEVYEDIYLLNKDNPYLKLKYRKFLRPYLRQLLASKKPLSFIKEALHCYQITGDTSYLKQDLKLFLKTIKSKF